MAYILGFLFADGNIIFTKRGTWFWSLQITDKEILEKIKIEIDSSHTISERNSMSSWSGQTGVAAYLTGKSFIHSLMPM